MNISNLYYFTSLYKQKNLNKAAKQSHITPQGLSKAINNLEKELGIELIDHTYNHIAFTPAGDFLYTQSQTILNDYNELLNGLEKMKKSPKGQIKIGIAYGVYVYFSNDFFKDFKEKFNNIELKIYEASDQNIEEMLKEKQIDIALSIGEYNHQYFDGKKLLSKKNYLICNTHNSLSKKSEIHIRDLNNQNFITLSSCFKSTHFLLDYLKENNINVNITETVSEMISIWQLCAENKGVSLIPEDSFPFFKSSNYVSPIKILPIVDCPFNTDIYVLTHANHKNYIANLLNQYITTKIKETMK